MSFLGRGIVINVAAPMFATPFITVLQPENLISDSFRWTSLSGKNASDLRSRTSNWLACYSWKPKCRINSCLTDRTPTKLWQNFHKTSTKLRELHKTSTKQQNVDNFSTKLRQNFHKTRDNYTTLRRNSDKVSTKLRQNFDTTPTKLRQHFDKTSTKLRQNLDNTPTCYDIMS